MPSAPSNALRVLFIGDLQAASASAWQRIWALEKCGATVDVINKREYQRSRLPRVARLLGTPNLMYRQAELERSVIEKLSNQRYDVVWFEWPREFTPAMMARIKKLALKAVFVGFQDDNPWGLRRNEKWIWKNYEKCIPYFDFNVVKRNSDVEALRALGAKDCILWAHGVYSPVFYPDDNAIRRYPVTFVGTCLDDRDLFIRRILDAGVEIHVFGAFWERRSDLPRRYPGNFHPSVASHDYGRVLRESQIGLGLVSGSNQDEWTMRTYEITGSGLVMCGIATATHRALFLDQEEAVFFTSIDECIDKLRFLTSSPKLCQDIGRAAFSRCVEGKYFIEQRMERLLDHVLERNI